MTLSNLIAGLGGSAMILAGIKVIFASGKIVRGQEQLEQAFADHRDEIKDDLTEIHEKLDDHAERILTLEIHNGLGGERRHIVRRTQDQHLREVRKMVNGEEL
jgi:hypothetical protein